MAKDVKKTAPKTKVLKAKNTKKTAPKKQITEIKSVKEEVKPAPKKVLKTPAYDDKMADAFIMEVDEEVKNDNLKVFWKKYGLFVVLFVVLVLSATVSFETIRNWRNTQLQAKTDNYLAATYAENPEAMLSALEKIAAGNNGIYSEIARIQMTDILFDLGKTEDAMNMLVAMSENDELNPRIRNLASIKLATHKIDTADFEEVEVLLTPSIDAGDSWTPIAKEYLALSAIQNGMTDKAREIYQSLLNDGNISDEFRNRIQDMLSALSDM